MHSIGDNTFVHDKAFIDQSLDYNILKMIPDSDSRISDRYTYREFRDSIFRMIEWFDECVQRNVYTDFMDERFIIIAIACMLSGKTLYTTINDHDKDVIKVNQIVETGPYVLTIEQIDNRLRHKCVGFALLYTSGSTGTPKPVRLSWYNIMAAVLCFYSEPAINHDGLNSILHCLPHSHIYGFLMELVFILIGSRFYYTAPPNLYASYMQHKPDIMPIVPQILNMFYEKRLPLKLNLLISAGAPLREEVYRFYDKTCRQILKGYGTTESSACLALSLSNDDDGICTMANRLKIAADGELLVSGLTVSDEVNRDADGWYHTNDIVSIDNNRIRIIGRKNNIIKLQQGEFINLDDLSNLYTQNGVETVVYASPLDRYPSAVVFVDEGIDRNTIENIFTDIHIKNNRKGYERIKDITVKNISDIPMKNDIRPDYALIRKMALDERNNA